MAWQDLTWEGCGSAVSDAQIAQMERLLGVRFPVDFRACVKECHGGTPFPRSFEFYDEHGRIVSCLGILFSFNEDDEESIANTQRMLAGQLPPGVIPFGEDGGGDCICFRFEQLETPPSVVYWHHERPIDVSITHLASSFGAFIDMLK